MNLGKYLSFNFIIEGTVKAENKWTKSYFTLGFCVEKKIGKKMKILMRIAKIGLTQISLCLEGRRWDFPHSNYNLFVECKLPISINLIRFYWRLNFHGKSDFISIAIQFLMHPLWRRSNNFKIAIKSHAESRRRRSFRFHLAGES